MEEIRRHILPRGLLLRINEKASGGPDVIRPGRVATGGPNLSWPRHWEAQDPENQLLSYQRMTGKMKLSQNAEIRRHRSTIGRRGGVYPRPLSHSRNAGGDKPRPYTGFYCGWAPTHSVVQITPASEPCESCHDFFLKENSETDSDACPTKAGGSVVPQGDTVFHTHYRDPAVT